MAVTLEKGSDRTHIKENKTRFISTSSSPKTTPCALKAYFAPISPENKLDRNFVKNAKNIT